MGENLQLPDGQRMSATEAERRFKDAMTAPEPDEAFAPAPPRAQPPELDGAPIPAPSAPAESGDAKARTAKPGATAAPPPAEGRRRGRPPGSKNKPKDSPAQPTVVVPEGTYVQKVDELLEALALGGAMVPIPAPASFVGKLLRVGPSTRTRVRLQAAVISENRGSLSFAIGKMATHNAVIRRGVDALTTGGATWVLPTVLMLGPFLAQTADVWTSEHTEKRESAAYAFENQVKAELKAQFRQVAEESAEVAQLANLAHTVAA